MNKFTFNAVDFKKFKGFCDDIREQLGLGNVQMAYYHGKIGRCMGEMQYKHAGQLCIITLSSDEVHSDMTKEEELFDTAQHEMLELLIAPLINTVEGRSNPEDIEAEAHRIIHSVQRVMA